MPQLPPDDDDDLELELEPIDPAVLAAEKARGAARTEQALSRLDVDEIVRTAEPDDEFDVDWSQLKQFRFSKRHLLILTAVVALWLSIRQRAGGVMALFVALIVGVVGGWMWVWRQERERQRRRDQHKAELMEQGWGAARAASAAPPVERPALKFAFSTRQLLAVTAGAAVLLVLLRALGPEILSLSLGAVAVLGLVLQIVGLEMPPLLVFSWWVLLVFYLAFGLIVALTTGPEQTVLREDAVSSEAADHA